MVFLKSLQNCRSLNELTPAGGGLEHDLFKGADKFTKTNERNSKPIYEPRLHSVAASKFSTTLVYTPEKKCSNGFWTSIKNFGPCDSQDLHPKSSLPPA